ncbi:MAG: O-antigen ligase family protein [Kiritimatiellia bacterium]|nr:O-antigen ligase family protein [Bacteroidales bacterium]
MSKIKDFYFFLVVLYSGMALAFFRSHEGLIALWALGLFIFGRETLYPSRKLFIALGVWMGYFTINTLIIRSFHPMFMGIYIAKIMIAYWLLTNYKEQIFKKYEDTIYNLTIISLALYSIQIIIPSQMWNIFQAIDLSEGIFPHKLYSSIGIYTFHQKNLSELFPRNSGFTWEPGPFSCYVMLALFFNIARNNIKIKDKKRLMVYITALITTQSSTGFIVLLAIIIWISWARFKNIAFKFLSVPIAISIVIYLFINLPWLQEKIVNEAEQDVEEIMERATLTGSSYAPGRFASFQMRWEDYKNYPIAGYGGKNSLQTGFISEDHTVSAINGIGTILGKYGSIGFTIFIWCIFSAGRWLGLYYKYTSHMIFPVLLLMIGFGFGIIESPIIVTLFLVSFFITHKNV